MTGKDRAYLQPIAAAQLALKLKSKTESKKWAYEMNYKRLVNFFSKIKKSRFYSQDAQ